MLVRTDLSLADQLVQVGHACMEAGHRFEQPVEQPVEQPAEQPAAFFNLVVLPVASREHLLDVLTRLRVTGIRYALFFEPDDQMGETAACTEPLTGKKRRIFRTFPLWSAPTDGNARGPPLGGPCPLMVTNRNYAVGVQG